MSYLCYADLPATAQQEKLLEIVTGDKLVSTALDKAEELDLPDWWLVSGVIYNSVWNHLTNRPTGYGIKDIDLFYFDFSSLSYESEDRHIKHGEALFADVKIPVEIRNQARVHLWYEKRFGFPCQPITSIDQSLRQFASRTHAVAVKRTHGQLEVKAPFGLSDIFSMRIAPNPSNSNLTTHRQKADRAQGFWPEVTIVD